jgi:SAM-dependent methyltransferase
MKDFAPACERNKVPILKILRQILDPDSLVLEIGSGTGQHAGYFACHLPQIRWQPSDLPDRLDSISSYRNDLGLANFLKPVGLDLLQPLWPIGHADAVVCINTIHIVPWRGVENLMLGVATLLPMGGLFYVYGPYRYSHRPLEPSNEEFDRWLRARDQQSGVRDFDAVDDLARQHGLTLVDDRPMPANNRSIWWTKN